MSSEPAEVQTMLETVHEALKEGQVETQVTWLLDSGFDDVAVWRTIWEQHEHIVCRVYHRDRLVEWQTESGDWSKGPLEEAAKRLKKLAMVRTKMEVSLGKQLHPKQQEADVAHLGLLVSAHLSQRTASPQPGERSDPAQGSLAGAACASSIAHGSRGG